MDHCLRKLDDSLHQIYSHTFAGRKGNVDGGLYFQQEQLQAPPSHRLDFSVNIHKKKRHGERIWNFGMYNAYGAKNPNWVTLDSREVKNPDTGKTTYTPALSKKTFLLFLPSFSYIFKF